MKKRTFAAYDDALGTRVIVGDIDGLLEYVRSYVLELEDGEELKMEIMRHDMTEEEIEAAPEIT